MLFVVCELEERTRQKTRANEENLEFGILNPTNAGQVLVSWIWNLKSFCTLFTASPRQLQVIDLQFKTPIFAKAVYILL